MKKLTLLALLLAMLATAGIAAPIASAASGCTFAVTGSTMTLQGDCTTDETIVVPDGFTLEGNGHTITAVDPLGDHFRGAVVRNGGTTAFVRRLGVTATGLTDVCDFGADRLRGILFDGASGKINRSVVTDINQGPSMCDEGNAIEVRNAPFDGTHPAPTSVSIRDNAVRRYQKTGISVNGDVSVRVAENVVVGMGAIENVAQNGVQLGFGALGSVYENHVSANVFSPHAGSAGILLYFAGSETAVEDNRVETNDVGIWIYDSGSSHVTDNVVTGSTSDGIALDDFGGPIETTVVGGNRVHGNRIGVAVYGATESRVRFNRSTENAHGIFVGNGATRNKLIGNRAMENRATGISVHFDANMIESNTAMANGELDISNIGSSAYVTNLCETSSGPPVDCGAQVIGNGEKSVVRLMGRVSRPHRPSALR